MTIPELIYEITWSAEFEGGSTEGGFEMLCPLVDEQTYDEAFFSSYSDDEDGEGDHGEDDAVFVWDHEKNAIEPALEKIVRDLADEDVPDGATVRVKGCLAFGQIHEGADPVGSSVDRLYVLDDQSLMPHDEWVTFDANRQKRHALWLARNLIVDTVPIAWLLLQPEAGRLARHLTPAGELKSMNADLVDFIVKARERHQTCELEFVVERDSAEAVMVAFLRIFGPGRDGKWRIDATEEGRLCVRCVVGRSGWP